MKLVSGRPSFSMKTYWCIKCNRFADAAPNHVPSCPVHGNTMVDNPSDPRRVEPNAPIEDKTRKPRRSRVYDTDELLQRTQALEGVVSSMPIPVISNAEDDDLRHEATSGLLARGCQVSISIPEPRHTWSGRLDPNWAEKFRPVLEHCEIAIYARRCGAYPNPATALELDILQKAGKKILVYEKDE